MTDFSTSVLRERFTIKDVDGNATPIVALSNRFALNLVDSNGQLIENLIIRGQMLHTVVRLSGSLLNIFQRTGPLLNRQVPLDWNHVWDMAAGPHERAHNDALWVVVYHNGKAIFQSGERHSFLDVIEQCEAQHSRNYIDSLRVAEDLFNKVGRPVTISHEANIAATFQIAEQTGRCALILRGARKTTTFVFHGTKKDGSEQGLNPVHFINAAAAFLEGIQLAFNIGCGNEKLRRDLIALYSTEGRVLTSARTRLGEINSTIKTFENLHDVHYRPERPEFSDLVISAEQVTQKRLEDEMADAADLVD